jgi:hypothetical protein
MNHFPNSKTAMMAAATQGDVAAGSTIAVLRLMLPVL